MILSLLSIMMTFSMWFDMFVIIIVDYVQCVSHALINHYAINFFIQDSADLNAIGRIEANGTKTGTNPIEKGGVRTGDSAGNIGRLGGKGTTGQTAMKGVGNKRTYPKGMEMS